MTDRMKPRQLDDMQAIDKAWLSEMRRERRSQRIWGVLLLLLAVWPPVAIIALIIWMVM
jgi:hypothetical protein